MGITIHYNGRLDHPRVLGELLITTKRFCREHNWKFQEIDGRVLGTVEHWTTIDLKNEELSNDQMDWTDTTVETQTVPIDDRQRGLLIHPHPESETVWLTFNQEGELCFYMPESKTVWLTFNQEGELCFYMPESKSGHYWENKLLFTKTQFAPIDVHMAICDLLHLIQDKYFPSLQVSDEGEYFETHDREHLAQKIGFLSRIMDRLETALGDENSDDPAVNVIRDAVDEADKLEGKPQKDKKRKLKVERGKMIIMCDPEWKRDHGISAGKN